MKKLQKWPIDWDYHILKYCDLYFYDKDIQYLNNNLWKEVITSDLEHINTTSINLEFKINKYYYLVNVNNRNHHFTCSIWRKTPLNTNSSFENISFICASGSSSPLQEIAGMGGQNLTSNELMEFTEQVILNDYKRREEDDDWDNDEEDEPIEPFSPFEMLEPELLTV